MGRFAALVCLALVAAGSLAAAKDDPNNGPTDACMMQAYRLAEEAERRSLSGATMTRLDGLFDIMGKQCKALETAKAEATAQEIRAVIARAK